jgi:hypothetical protein
VEVVARVVNPLRHDPATGQISGPGLFDIILDSDVQKSISIVINGRKVPIRWVSSTRFVASVDEGVLVKDTNTIELDR